MYGIAVQVHESRKKQYGDDAIKYILKMVSISTIDNLWMEHLTSMEDLRTGIGLRGYGQRDPLIEYKNEAFGLFEKLMDEADYGIVTRMFKVHLEHTPVPEAVAEKNKISTNQPSIEVSEGSKSKKTETDSNGKKLGRNDPCWCGSGKKWKKCHYPQTG